MPMFPLMMRYKEANVELSSSLTPDNRCICKKTAIANGALTTPLQSFTDNRLVPASKVNVAIVTYIITWDVDGVTSTTTVNAGVVPSKESPTKAGYTFNGWQTAGGLAPYAADKNETYYAQFTANAPSTVTLTFMSDGVQYHLGTYTPGDTLDDPRNTSATPLAKTGANAADYTFVRWEDLMGNAMPATVPNANTIYYAAWTSPYTYITDLGFGIYDRAEEGEPVREGTILFDICPWTTSQNNSAPVTGAKSVTIHVYNGHQYTNVVNDSVNKTYTLHEDTGVAVAGTITIENWGITATSGSVRPNAGHRWKITFSESLANLGWAPEDWFDTDNLDQNNNNTVLARTVNADNSVSYRLVSYNGSGLNEDPTDLQDSRYQQRIQIAVNKDASGVDPGRYYKFDVKIDPKYTAARDEVYSSNTTAGLSFYRWLHINLATA